MKKEKGEELNIMTVNDLNYISSLEGMSPIEYLNKHAKILDIYYSGWEVDEIAWKINDTIFRTDHLRMHVQKKEDFQKYINNLKAHIRDAEEFIES